MVPFLKAVTSLRTGRSITSTCASSSIVSSATWSSVAIGWAASPDSDSPSPTAALSPDGSRVGTSSVLGS